MALHQLSLGMVSVSQLHQQTDLYMTSREEISANTTLLTACLVHNKAPMRNRRGRIQPALWEEGTNEARPLQWFPLICPPGHFRLSMWEETNEVMTRVKFQILAP
jgi:hypothetical protein